MRSRFLRAVGWRCSPPAATAARSPTSIWPPARNCSIRASTTRRCRNCSSAVELNKDSIHARVALGQAYRGLKRYDDALDTFRAAKKIDRYVVAPHIASALTRVETGQIEIAIDELNHVIELEPKNLQAKILLGRVSMMPYRQPDGTVGVSKASLERAEMNLKSAIAAAPDNIEAQRELALAYEKLGKKADAVKSWTTVRELAPTDATHAQESPRRRALPWSG